MEKCKVISISLPKETVKKLKEKSEQTGLSISAIVNIALNKIEIKNEG